LAAKRGFPKNFKKSGFPQKLSQEAEIEHQPVLVGAQEEIVQPAPDGGIFLRPIRKPIPLPFLIGLDRVFQGGNDNSDPSPGLQNAVEFSEQISQLPG
jgi:hypothetical protein